MRSSAARPNCRQSSATPCARSTPASHSIGMLALAVIFFRAYSLGGGTYTGIEAVSNGLPILREPRAETGKRTMIYMALSLAFVAGGILLSYLLLNVEAEAGKTLNAVMFEKLATNWQIFGLHVGPEIITFALLTEGALLFVAAQTGFVDGPRVLATMATDRWLPRRFANLSARLVTQDGVITIGLAAILLLIGTEAKVDLLVVLYAINVFVTFTLSQLGMTTHWWIERKTEKRWLRKMLINGVGTFFTATILMITLTLKFHDGGWVTVLITGGLIALCYTVRRHYERVSKAIEQLEADILPKLYAVKKREPAKRDPNAPTAAILVSGYNGLGLATLIAVTQLFKDEFRNVVFIGVGEVDAALLKGPEEVHELETRMTEDLNEYCQFAADLGLHPELRAGLAPDVVVELRRLCLEVAHEFPHVVFFAGKLIFSDEVEGLHRPLPAQSHLARTPELAPTLRLQPGNPPNPRRRRLNGNPHLARTSQAACNVPSVFLSNRSDPIKRQMLAAISLDHTEPLRIGKFRTDRIAILPTNQPPTAGCCHPFLNSHSRRRTIKSRNSYSRIAPLEVVIERN